MSKNPQSNTKRKKPVEINPQATTEIYDQYVNYQTNKVVQTNRLWATTVGRDLVAYAKKPDVLRIEPFPQKFGITRMVWKRLVKVYPDEIGIMLEEAKDIIGERRLRHGLGFEGYKKLDTHLIEVVQHQYHPDFKEAEEYHDERKIKTQKDEGKQGPTHITVVGPDWLKKPEEPNV